MVFYLRKQRLNDRYNETRRKIEKKKNKRPTEMERKKEMDDDEDFIDRKGKEEITQKNGGSCTKGKIPAN